MTETKKSDNALKRSLGLTSLIAICVGMVVGQGCDTVGIAIVKAAPSSENRFLGCVAYFPEKYGDYLVSVAVDVMAGKPVPNEVHMEHTFLDNSTIGKYYK